MALKALMLRKRLNDANKELEGLRALDESFVTREAELEASISEVNTEEERDAVSAAIDEFESDKQSHEEKKADLERQVADLEAELQGEEEKQEETPADPEPVPEETNERKEEKMEIRESKEYLDAYVRMVKNGLRNGNYDDTEVRALLTESVSGTVPVPTYVEGRIKTAWEKNGLMDLVTKTYVKGNLKIGYEKSADPAVPHEEGDDPVSEETLLLGTVNLIPINFKKYLRLSDEVYDLSSEDFISYVYDEMAYQIAKAVSDYLIGQIAALDGTGLPVGTFTGAPALNVLANAVAQLSDECDDITAVMNKGTWAALISAQASGNYAFDPFSYVNRTIFTSTLKSYDDASADEVYMIVGDFRVGAHANFPAGAEIKFTVDPYTDAPADLIRIIGRQFVGIAPVGPNAFCQVIKPDEE